MSDGDGRSRIETSIDELLRRDRITRRSFIGRAGRGTIAVGSLLSIPGLLAACVPAGNASASASAGSSGGGGGPATGTVRWLNWPAYIDISDDGSTNPSIDAFTEQTDIKLQYDEGLLDNADFLAQYSPDLRAGNNTGWDVMTPGGWVVERMARNDWLEELDHSKLPNWTANCADYAKGLWFDPENKHSLWWQGGITGIAYDPNLTGREITTFDDLLDPKFDGVAGGFSDMRDMFGLTLLSIGVEPANATVDDVKKAQQKLLNVPKGHFRGFYGNEYYDALAAGDLAISVAWSGDISQMNLYDNDKVKFVVPDTGGMRWNDNLVIPKGGANIEEALKLLDYYYSVPAATMLSEYVGYFTPVNGVSEQIAKDADAAKADGDKETADLYTALAPTVVPDPSQISNTFTDKQLDENEERQWNDLFEAVVGA
ncbi:MAG TPA: spermidine/putrescine ABC transporter substrate-binding protein [Candidatus Limnocylindria bacterium]|jgi:spermidine/putrescine transport system substrate-binding protein